MGLQDFTVKESIAPYHKAVVSDGSTPVDECRGIHMKGASTDVNLTINGTVVAFHLLKGHTYPIACTLSSSSDVVHLY